MINETSGSFPGGVWRAELVFESLAQPTAVTLIFYGGYDKC